MLMIWKLLILYIVIILLRFHHDSIYRYSVNIIRSKNKVLVYDCPELHLQIILNMGEALGNFVQYINLPWKEKQATCLDN